MSPFARDLMENSKRDDCMIVGSDVRALCMEILKLEKERDDPLEQARRELPVFSALRAEVERLKVELSGRQACDKTFDADHRRVMAERDAARAEVTAERERRETDYRRLNNEIEKEAGEAWQAEKDRDAARAEVTAERERREAAEAITNDWQAALKQESAAHNATKGALEAALAEIEESRAALPDNIPFKDGSLAARIRFVLARNEVFKGQPVTLPSIYDKDDPAWAQAIEACAEAVRAAGMEVL